MDETLNEKIFPFFFFTLNEIRERIVEKIFVPNKSYEKSPKFNFFMSLFFRPKKQIWLRFQTTIKLLEIKLKSVGEIEY